MYRYLLGILLLVGCASEKTNIAGKNAEIVYNEAIQLLKQNDYEDAAKKFKEIDTYFPYAEKASLAQIMSAYCNFQAGSYTDAISGVDVFLRYHPAHELVPYAMYLKAMSLYVIVSSVGRDSQQALDAKKAFVELFNRFPKSKYAVDAMKRIIILDDLIASHELMVGRFYQKNKNALAAIGRYDYVIVKFPNTNAAEEALYRLIECCKSIGLIEEADKAIKSFKARYPNSSWELKF